jgi:phosphopantothenoylcysteine decarboxylase/phosphopantothenate--cysteine ligase
LWRRKGGGVERKNVLLCITGSISAYKAADIARELMRGGCDVQTVLTEGARHFITVELMSALTGRHALSDLWEEPQPGKMAHIDLARAADVFLCAPASAQTIAKFALGLADDLVGALFLAYQGPVLIAPAMNPAMWAAPAVRQNVATLRSRGVRFVEPAFGEVACGEEGQGKLATIEDIVSAALSILRGERLLAGVRVVVTSGPTREPLDPVRFIGNRSSGKMGHAIATEALSRGATVTLISGPTALPDPPGATVVRVETAAEMASAAGSAFKKCDLFIGAAAVSDFRPRAVSPTKLKRAAPTPTLPRKRGRARTVELEPTEDIIAGLAKGKKKQVIVGFAAESEDLLKNAKAKLDSKGLDLIVANDITEPGSGFDTDTNRVTLLFRDGRSEALPLMTKREVAARVLDAVAPKLPQR